MAFAVDAVGRFTGEHEFAVEASRAMAYAAATNDPISEHVEGVLAPPVFAVVPAWDAMLEAVGVVTPPEVRRHVLHSEHDIVIHRAIAPGTRLLTRAAPIGVHVKKVGTSVVVKTETRDASTSALVNEQHAVMFFRGTADGESRGEEAPRHRVPASARAGEPVASVAQTFDAGQTFRYSAASGDTVPIHLDDEVARSVGLPGIIVHGLCTMAFNSWAAVVALASGDPTRLRRLAVRFSQPVLPGQTITTRFVEAGRSEGSRVLAYESKGPDGGTVVKDGLVEILP